MCRPLAAAAVVGAVAATGALIRMWWTAPPRGPASALAAALALAPGESDGAIALAQPGRWARWLASHPQALALLRIAAPSADRSLPRLRGFLTALAREARGPVTLWWRDGELAGGATVGAGASRALQRLAALEGFAIRTRPRASGVLVTVATADPLLGEPRLQAPPGGPNALAALARVGANSWRVHVGRSVLELTSGDAPAFPPVTAANPVATGDVAALLAPAATPGWLPHTPARLAFDARGWAVSLPEATLSPEVARLLSLRGDLPGGGAGGVRRWQGPLGDLWVRPGAGITMASEPGVLEALPAASITGESGSVRGPDLARACRRIAEACDHFPGGEDLAAGLRRAAPLLDRLKSARWRLLPAGGHVLLEW